MAHAQSADVPPRQHAPDRDPLHSERLQRAFRDEERAAVALATRAQIVTLVVIAVWLFVWVPPPRVYFLEMMLGLFALTAGIQYRLRRPERGGRLRSDVFVAIYMGLLTFSMVGYDLLIGDRLPPQVMLRNGTFVYFFLFVALAALTYSPHLVLWAGFIGAVSWSIGVGLIIAQPGTLTSLDLEAKMSAPEFLAVFLHPRFVDTDVWIQDVVVLLLVAGTLAAGTRRGRNLVMREAAAARERANLARYFSPRMVDELARSDEPLGAVRAQPVAVLFADIVGFTRIAERASPEETVALLRTFHAHLEEAVFEHGGTLDKYLGDGIMATFGTPRPGAHDAANALAAARAMLGSIEAWNAERVAAGAPPIRLSIGIHYGAVVLGDIGTERRLEFAVIGDVVNVASRLEALTRSLDTPLVVSNALITAVHDEGGQSHSALLAGLARVRPRMLPGRDAPVEVWTLAA